VSVWGRPYRLAEWVSNARIPKVSPLFMAAVLIGLTSRSLADRGFATYSSVWSQRLGSSSPSPYDRIRPLLDLSGMPEQGAGLWENLGLPLLTRIRVAEYYDDNVFYNDLNRRSSFVTIVNPQFLVPMRRGKQNLGLAYSFRGSVYENAPQNNYVDNYLNGFADLEFTHRAHLLLSAGASFAHNPIGTVFSQGNIATTLNEPDEYQSQYFGALFRYGADKAKGRIDLYFDYIGQNYLNHLERTRQRDVNVFTMGGAFYYRFLPKTSALFEVREIVSDYLFTPIGVPSLSSLQSHYFTGLTWEPTAKTTGTIRVGYLTKDFDDPARPSQSMPTYEAALSWAPKTYSMFRLAAERTVNETLFTGFSLAETQYYALSWNHDWLERVSTRLEVNATDYRYIGIGPSDLTYKGYGIFAGFFYKPRHWLTTGLNYFYNERTSNQQQFDYSRNMIELSFQMNM
jgi:hypothetical protein